MDGAADAQEEEEESTATIGPHIGSRSTPLAHLLRRRRQRSPPEDAAAAPPSLNYGAPFMSLRTPNHSPIPNSATAARPSPPPPAPSAAKLSSELSREPLRRAGTVPFAWEQSPGRRKPPSPSPSLLPPPPPPPPIVTLRELFRHDHHSFHPSSSDPSTSPAASPPPADPPGGRPSNASQRPYAASAAMSPAGGADDNDSSRDSYTSAFELGDHMSASVLSAATSSPAAAAMDGRPPAPQSEIGHLLLLHRFLPAAHALACSSSTDHRSPLQIPTSGRPRAPPPPLLPAMDCPVSTDAMDAIPAKTAELASVSPPPDLIPANNRLVDSADNAIAVAIAIDSARYSAAAIATTASDDDEDDDCAAAADRSSCGLFTLMRVRSSLTSCAGPAFCSPGRHHESMASSSGRCHSSPHAIASSPQSTNQSASRSTSKMLEKPLKLRSEGGGISTTMRMRDFLLYDGETVPVSSTINMESQSLISACSNGSVTRICADSSCCSSSSRYSDSPRANDGEVMNTTSAIDGAAKDAAADDDGGGCTNRDLNHERLSRSSVISASNSTISTDQGYNSSNGGSDGSVISSSSSGSSSTNYRRSIHGATKCGRKNQVMVSPKAAWTESIGSPPLPRSPTQSWLHGSRSTAGIQSRLGRGSRAGEEGRSEPSKSDAPMDATWEAMVRGAHVGQPGHLRFSEELHQQPKKIATLEIGG